MSEKCGCCIKYANYDHAFSSDDCVFDEAIAHLKALILAQAFRSEVSDAASKFVDEHS